MYCLGDRNDLLCPKYCSLISADVFPFLLQKPNEPYSIYFPFECAMSTNSPLSCYLHAINLLMAVSVKHQGAFRFARSNEIILHSTHSSETVTLLAPLRTTIRRLQRRHLVAKAPTSIFISFHFRVRLSGVLQMTKERR